VKPFRLFGRTLLVSVVLIDPDDAVVVLPACVDLFYLRTGRCSNIPSAM